MAEDEGGPPELIHVSTDDQTYDRDKSVKGEENFDSKPASISVEISNIGKSAGISIAERRAAKYGFNASNIKAAQFRTAEGDLAAPPCVTIPSGISPSALLDSPIMLPNAQAQSPTTGTFQFSAPNHESSKLKLKRASSEDGAFVMDQSYSKHETQGFHPSVANNLLVENKQPLEDFEYPKDLQEITKRGCSLEDMLVQSTPALGNNKFREAVAECSSMQPRNTRNQMANHSDQSGKERSTQYPSQYKCHQKGAYIPKEVAKYSEDGFYWRKYGQKHVKGSEYPRSYYKCTNTNCLVKKKVERSHDGQITEIVYKGSHNHPKPQPFKRSGEMSSEMNEGSGPSFKTESAIVGGCSSDWKPDNTDGISSTPFLSDFSSPMSRQMNSTFESMGTQEISSAFGSQDGDAQNEASPESISFNDEEDDNGECEAKRRKRESFSNETAIPRSTREPRVVVQIESDVDILDDGYRWRKYGQKVVKGNPNPRSYYKCTTPGCPVRKHVERAATDIKSVITTYEGKHNHEVPSNKTGSQLAISDAANHPSPAVGNSTIIPAPSQMVHKPDHVSKAGKLVQDHLPSLYLERKPILNYNELMMRSNLPGNLANDLNFGPASSVYPLSFPSFHSLPYGSLLMNGNRMKSCPASSSHVYQMFPEYMSLPSSQINQVPAAGPAASNMPLAGTNFNFNNYNDALQHSARGQEIRGCNARILKPKEEHRDDGELYNTCLSIPDHGNGTA